MTEHGGTDVRGLVLAGGRSRRMGSDKAALVIDGATQLDRAVALLARHLDDVRVSTRADQADDVARRRYPQIHDRYEGLGPVAGILSALEAVPDATWLVLACDLPNIDDETIVTLLAAADRDEPVTAYRSAAGGRHEGLPEPLCALWRPAAATMIQRFVAEDVTCPRKMLIRSGVELLEQPRPGALINVNTPEDLEGLRAGSTISQA